MTSEFKTVPLTVLQPKTERVCVNLSEDLHNQIAKLSHERNLSKSGVICFLVACALSRE